MTYFFVLTTLLSVLVLETQDTKNEYIFRKAVRMDLKVEYFEKGEILPAKRTDVICQVRAKDAVSPAGHILWLIEDGRIVKASDTLLQLDDSAAKESWREQQIKVEEAKTSLVKEREDAAIIANQALLEMKKLELEVESAKSDLNQAKDESTRKTAENKASLLRAAMQVAKEKYELTRKRSHSGLTAFEKKVELAIEKLKELEENYKRCVITAPHEGFLSYATSESSRFGGQNSLEVGAAVKAGQKLFQLSDLNNMQCSIKIHESDINRIKLGMEAFVKISGVTFKGRVSEIGIKAASGDFLSPDVKTFPIRIDLEKNERSGSLKPNMTAEAAIQIAEKKNILVVPLQAVRQSVGVKQVFVKDGDSVRQQEIKTGIANDRFIEIMEGISEGEEIVVNPPRSKLRGDLGKSYRLILQSIKSKTEPARRNFVDSYGVTERDVKEIRALVPQIVNLVLVRKYYGEARAFLGKEHMLVNIIATTSNFPLLHNRLTSEMDGRFLTDSDESDVRPIAVLGASVAEKLFPFGDGLGRSVRLGKDQIWQVAGVLAKQSSKEALDYNESIFLPYRSHVARHGKQVMIRTSGSRSMEKVDYSEVVFEFANQRDRHEAFQLITARMQATHDKEDWMLLRK